MPSGEAARKKRDKIARLQETTLDASPMDNHRGLSLHSCCCRGRPVCRPGCLTLSGFVVRFHSLYHSCAGQVERLPEPGGDDFRDRSESYPLASSVWSKHDCIICQPYDLEKGAGTLTRPLFCAPWGRSPGVRHTSSRAVVRPTDGTVKTPTVCSTIISTRWSSSLRRCNPVVVPGQSLDLGD